VDKQIALACVAEECAKLKRLSYADLARLIDHPRSKFVTGADGKQYQLEIQVFWDRRKDGDLRVVVSVDDGGLRAFMPLTNDFIMSPTGELL
jgi:hypothetical protein